MYLAVPGPASEPSSANYFQVICSATVQSPLTVTYTVSGTATANVDYQALSGSVVIPAGQSSALVWVTPIDDALLEGDETVSAQLTVSAGYGLGSPSGLSMTLSDNDQSTITVQASDSAAAETGADVGVYTLTRTGGNTSSALTVNYTVSGTATSGSDYNALSGAATFAANATTATVTLTPIDDSVVNEGNETAVLNISASSTHLYNLGAPASATVNIADNDKPTLNFVSPVDAVEPSTVGNCYFSAGVALATALTVNYTVSGTATAGSDYVTLTGTATIPAGASGVSINITPIDDSFLEGNETVVVQLSAGASYNLGPANSCPVIIRDNDQSTITVQATDSAASEPGSNTGQFTFTRAGGNISGALTVNYTVTGTATSGSDYTALAGSVTFGANQTTATVTVTPITDITAESSETVIVSVATSSTGLYNVGSPSSATVTIADAPVVWISAGNNAVEPSAVGFFNVGANQTLTSPLVVSFWVSGGTASSGTDYSLPGGGTVTIPAGSSSTTITVTPVDDALYEGTETVQVNIGTGPDYNLYYNSAIINVLDNDQPQVTVSVSAHAAEPSTSGQFTITRTAPLASALTVSYTMSGTASSGSDYTALSGSVTIPANTASASVSVTPIDDFTVEGTESIILTISNPSSGLYRLGSPANATMNLVDNDPPTVTVTASDSSAAEPGSNTGAFTFTRSGGNLGASLTVNYTVSGTATAGSDYTSLIGSFTFPAGQSTALVTVTPTSDVSSEPTETVIVSISASGTGSYNVGSPGSATVNILDAPVVWISGSINASEPNSPGTFSVATGAPATSPLVVSFTVTGGSAVNGTDYTISGSPVTIPVGATSASITVTPIDDTAYEGTESVTVTIAPGSNYNLYYNTTTINLLDNDQPQVTATVAAHAAEPSTPGQFTISRTAPLSSALTVNYTRSGTATSGSDFTALSSSVTIPANAASVSIPVTPIDDFTVEGTETIVLTISNPSSGLYRVGSPSSATMNIADNDVPPTVSIPSTGYASEPNLPGEMILVRSGPVNNALSVTYTVAGTATAGQDYVALSGSVTFAAGSQTASIAISPIDDSFFEQEESITISILPSGTGAYTIGQPNSGMVRLIDNDIPKVLFYGPTSGLIDPQNIAGGFTTRAYEAATPGIIVTVWDEATWASKTTADFAQFDAIVFGDQPPCDFNGNINIWDTAIANRATWSQAINGNIMIMGTDPAHHDKRDLIQDAVRFACSDSQAGPGLYVALGCYYHHLVDASSPIPVQLLGGLGTFNIVSVGEEVCPIVARKVSTHPVLRRFSSSDLSGWNCSTHEGFTSWPASFMALAMITDIDPLLYTPGFTSPANEQGLVYMLARGNGLAPVSLEILTHPESQRIFLGAAITLSVTATGSGTLDYRWYKNGVIIPGATSPDLVINSAAFSDAGEYVAEVSNSTGSIASRPAFLDFDEMRIRSQPSSLTVEVGQSSRFEVYVDGTGPFSYQWYFNGLPIGGATGSSYTIANTQLSNAGQYSVRVGNASGYIDSSAAVLTLRLPAVVFTPSGSTLPFNVSLSVPGQSGVTIYYTIDGSTPSTASAVYSTPVAITTRTILSAYAVKGGYGDSPFNSATFGAAGGGSLSATISAPANGSTQSGTITIDANGFDDIRTIEAGLYVDNVKVAGAVFASPYHFTLDTTRFANGSHSVKVRVADIDGNTAYSAPITIFTDNLIHGFDSTRQAFTPDFDDSDDIFVLSANFKVNSDWVLTFRNLLGFTVAEFSGQGTTMSAEWDGFQNVAGPMSVVTGPYEYSLRAASADDGGISQQEATWRALWVAKGAPDWSNQNINFHAISAKLIPNWYIETMFNYVRAYSIVFSLHITLPQEIYTHSIRNYGYLLGYTGDQINNFVMPELYAALATDQMLYILTHGAAYPEAGFTILADTVGNTTSGSTLRQQWAFGTAGGLYSLRPQGFMFVQVNACNSATVIDAQGNNDIAAGLGIFATPLTKGRAYLGWNSYLLATLRGAFEFDQRFWDRLSSGMPVQNAALEAHNLTGITFGFPIIVGDSSLVLPDNL